MIGIEFKYFDGTSDWFDPVDYPTRFKETEDSYSLKVLQYNYVIEKSKVSSIRHYELCECGYELFIDGCKNYKCKK